MKIKSPRQLKDWINNMAKRNNLVANTVLQNFVMERLLERVSVSRYKDNFILKGGFLISAMVGLDMRSTMDMDTTIKGVSVSRETIEEILDEILSIDLDDNLVFKIKSIKSIHDISEYDDYRIVVEAQFFTIRVNMKIDITTGDEIIPSEIDYSYKLMFEERSISIKAYNLDTILAEKIESILVRNVSNTRARDFYDVYILMTLRRDDLELSNLRNAIQKKAIERNSLIYIENHQKYLKDIAESKDIYSIWDSYKRKFSYAEGIDFADILKLLRTVFESKSGVDML
ncbi:Predicted nucleotidyltransferase component of viral defense system [Dethiosulfatibacter aminovorans DSM 17477]|uniref:Predicted nucleotidyltransferase component of viral defense system n=1 Tax=Dethiosulfatibacter aminovorans DSM 17477 TaxID=1121476 RepID=A0A1M6MSG8_9FIRM|nr:nucleotidyl transferase AbiEii/AbiGii toxin family protein [Dethiosulfatibacter aminovorans]SHJ86411.1 Predicted nucleotidyltransferase component of viral defense system [Dethiosulfatibacter aminovorans DSM 17477]